LAGTRFLRNKDLIKQSLLDEVTIIGAGGVGSSLIMNAAIMGFSHIHVWDFDMLETHNLSTTAYPEEYLNQPKVDAAEKQAKLYNKNVVIHKHNEPWESGKYLSPLVMMAPDNMEIRMEVYTDWYLNRRGFLIDMRMGAVTMELITASPENDNFRDTWQPSNDIADEACTAKHTIFTASIISGLGLNQAFNCLHSMQYYQYIWGSLSPFSFRKEGLILNQKGELHDRSQQGGRQVVTRASQRSDVVLHRPTEDREDDSSVSLEYERL
jgi:hypothetical protein